jgi:poly(3-hydroxybutyrate) depolymerase
MRSVLKVLLPVLILALAVQAQASDSGKEQFVFDRWDGPAINVFVTRPPGIGPDRPVVIVMHGMRRNADEYRDQWHDLAVKHDFLLIVPGFSSENFPGSRGYNLGNTFGIAGSPVDRGLWSFSAIEKIFDDVLRRYEMNAGQYAIYGHSAGSQFVHRFLMHVPDARVSSAVAANAGWYTLPDFSVDYPVGLKGSAVVTENLASFFRTSLTILLGDQDTDADDDSLRRNDEVNVQGPHRLARGHYFFTSGSRVANSMGLLFAWKLAEVAGADHDNRLMAPQAVEHLLGD